MQKHLGTANMNSFFFCAIKLKKIKNYKVKLFRNKILLCYFQIKYHSRAIPLYKYLIDVARKRNEVKINAILGSLRVHNQHLLRILALLVNA